MGNENFQNHNLKYRPDIDGLRAIAVISVILFHFSNKILPAGFVGVDIFFVISGFLITSIIYREMLSGKFSFIEFYKRRIKRIMPAFFACIVVTTIVGFSIVTKNDMKPFARSIISSIFSAANIYFYKTLKTGYFDDNSHETPLLHMWSLGVEEQFYMLWPFVLVILTKINYRLLVSVVSLMIFTSFAYAEIALHSDAKFVYYIIFTRAGELLMGSLLGLLSLNIDNRKSPTKVLELISITGLVLIVWSIIYTDKSHFPGIGAIWPCLGTCMIIYAGFFGNCVVNKCLALKPIVFIGLISYSLYLWHWPVIAFSNYLYLSHNSYYGVVFTILTFGLSLFSYHMIELPIRRSKMSRAQVFVLLYCIPALLITAISASFFSPKVRDYFVPTIANLEKDESSMIASSESYSHYCFSGEDPQTDLIKAQSCINGNNHNLEPNMLFFGDSHAMHYVDFLDVLGKYYKFSFRAISRLGCPSTLLNSVDYGNTLNNIISCTKFRKLINNHITEYKYVIMSSFWDAVYYSPELKQDFENTVKWLVSKDIKVIILGNVPVFQDYKVGCRDRALRHKFIQCKKNMATSYNIDVIRSANVFLEELTHKYDGVYYMDATNVICPDKKCSAYIKDELIYFDTNHLSLKGSKILGEEFIKHGNGLPSVFQEIIKSQN